MATQRDDVEFASGAQTCRAWWYQASAPNGGCVVMAHGLGGVRTAGLEPYAQLFADAGFAVLLFDYRHFGASDGAPRQQVSVARQLADWSAAIAFARSQPAVDTADAEPGYRSIVGADWINGICASFALGLAFYRPVTLARRVKCPALVIVADTDSVAPAAAAVRTARRIGGRCELHHLAMGHFDLYTGEGFERGVALQLEFLLRVVRPVQPAPRSTRTALVPPKAKELDSIVRAATPLRERFGT